MHTVTVLIEGYIKAIEGQMTRCGNTGNNGGDRMGCIIREEISNTWKICRGKVCSQTIEITDQCVCLVCYFTSNVAGVADDEHYTLRDH